MAELLTTYWPVLSALAVICGALIAWRSEVSVRLSQLEQKVITLFELINSRSR